jgi:adenine phosphoribosyltransferase
LNRLTDFVKVLPYDESLLNVKIRTAGLSRTCPLVHVDDELWVVENEHLCYGADIQFTKAVGKCMAEMIEPFKPDCIITAASKSIGMAYEMSKFLGHERLVIATKNKSSKFIVKTKSITSNKEVDLSISDYGAKYLNSRSAVIFDDVISTCSTINGLIKLAKAINAKIECYSSVWIEGPWPLIQFEEEYASRRLKFLDVLPIFAKGETYKKLINETKKIKQ